MSLTRRELTEKVNKLELRLDLSDFNTELKEYWLFAFEFVDFIVVRSHNSSFSLCYGKLSDCKDRFEWYKKWLEDWTIIVELNEEETEKVTKGKKKSKKK